MEIDKVLPDLDFFFLMSSFIFSFLCQVQSKVSEMSESNSRIDSVGVILKFLWNSSANWSVPASPFLFPGSKDKHIQQLRINSCGPFEVNSRGKRNILSPFLEQFIIILFLKTVTLCCITSICRHKCYAI